MRTLIIENEDIDIWEALSSFLNFSLYFLAVPRAAGAIRKLSQKIALGWFSDPYLPTLPHRQKFACSPKTVHCVQLQLTVLTLCLNLNTRGINYALFSLLGAWVLPGP